MASYPCCEPRKRGTSGSQVAPVKHDEHVSGFRNKGTAVTRGRLPGANRKRRCGHLLRGALHSWGHGMPACELRLFFFLKFTLKSKAVPAPEACFVKQHQQLGAARILNADSNQRLATRFFSWSQHFSLSKQLKPPARKQKHRKDFLFSHLTQLVISVILSESLLYQRLEVRQAKQDSIFVKVIRENSSPFPQCGV